MDHPQPLSDDEIISLFLQRSESAISETDRKYRNYLHTIAYNILLNREDSEECLNDTYWKTWNSIPPTIPKILRAFLAKITRNTAIDRYDEATRQKRIPKTQCDSLSDFEDFLPQQQTVESILESKAIGQIISAYLSQVSDRQLYIFLSRYYFLAPIAQIAANLHLSESTIHKTLASMKQELRRQLEKGGIPL